MATGEIRKTRSMKRIITGKRYDTETAICIGTASQDQSRSDFSYWEAGLYVTPRSKAYFLAGEGGPMTRFARSLGNRGQQYGENIFPMTPAEALEWAEQHLTVDEVEEHFGDMIEDA